MPTGCIMVCKETCKKKNSPIRFYSSSVLSSSPATGEFVSPDVGSFASSSSSSLDSSVSSDLSSAREVAVAVLASFELFSRASSNAFLNCAASRECSSVSRKERRSIQTIRVGKSDGQCLGSGRLLRVVRCDLPDPTSVRADIGLKLHVGGD